SSSLKTSFGERRASYPTQTCAGRKKVSNGARPSTKCSMRSSNFAEHLDEPRGNTDSRSQYRRAPALARAPGSAPLAVGSYSEAGSDDRPHHGHRGLSAKGNRRRGLLRTADRAHGGVERCGLRSPAALRGVRSTRLDSTKTR